MVDSEIRKEQKRQASIKFRIKYPESNKESARKFRKNHPEIVKENNRIHQERFPDYSKEHNNKYYKENSESFYWNRIKNKYNLTSKEYTQLLKQQDNVCASCKQPETMMRNGKIRRLAVDHDHKTGKVRGLLCSKCNTALGCIDDNLEKLELLRKYLEEFIDG